jgi:hypothetical protein
VRLHLLATMVGSHVVVPLVFGSVAGVENLNHCDASLGVEKVCCFANGGSATAATYQLQGCRFISLVPLTSSLLCLICVAAAASVLYYVRMGSRRFDEREIDAVSCDGGNKVGDNSDGDETVIDVV